MPATIDITPFNPQDTDRNKINNGNWVPCRICKEIYLRLRLTSRYCASCGRAFCEGEHGRFAQGQPAFCVRCFQGDQNTELL